MDLLQGLYREHLEVIAPIYDNRLWAFKNREWNLSDTVELDNRLEPHIDALAQNDGALTLCEKQVVEGNSGECYGAVRVLARHNRWDGILNLIRRMDASDSDRTKAVANALCHESVFPLRDDFYKALLKSDADRALIAVHVMSFHRLGFETELLKALNVFSHEKNVILKILMALGRLRLGHGAEQVLGYLSESDTDIMNAAITALLRIGNERLIENVKAIIPTCHWPALALGLFGDKEALTDVLFESDQSISPDHMIAAGLSGDVSFVPDLIDRLENPALSENAAYALEMITGFGFFETHFEADVASEDDLFSDEEKEAWRNGTYYPDGRIPGRTLTRLSRDPYLWTEEFRKKQNNFDPEKRFRYGKPTSPSCLFDELKSQTTPDFIRQLACDELVIRYGIDIPFETGMTAMQQRYVFELMAS